MSGYETIGDFLEEECKKDYSNGESFYVCKVKNDSVLVPMSDELKNLSFSEDRKNTILEMASENIALNKS